MKEKAELWVAGWSTQLLLIVATGIMLWYDLPDQASVYITGSLIIGVIRQIEKDRRASTKA